MIFNLTNLFKLIFEFGGIIFSSKIKTFSNIIFLSSLIPKILILGVSIGLLELFLITPVNLTSFFSKVAIKLLDLNI